MGMEPALDDRRQLSRQANEALDKSLEPGELVRVIIRGVYDSAIIGLDSRLCVFKPGLMSSGPFGHKLHSWAYRDICGATLTTSLLFGIVALEDVRSSPGTVSVWTADRDSIRKSGKALDLGRRNFREARERVPLLRRLIADWQAAEAIASASEPIPEELSKHEESTEPYSTPI